MDDETRARALLALDLVTAARPDAELALLLDGPEQAAVCLARLTGHVLQLLAAHRGELVAETSAFVRHTLDRR